MASATLSHYIQETEYDNEEENTLLRVQDSYQVRQTPQKQQQNPSERFTGMKSEDFCDEAGSNNMSSDRTLRESEVRTEQEESDDDCDVADSDIDEDPSQVIGSDTESDNTSKYTIN